MSNTTLQFNHRAPVINLRALRSDPLTITFNLLVHKRKTNIKSERTESVTCCADFISPNPPFVNERQL